MNDDATEQVIALAKHVVSHMQATFPGWREVYFVLTRRAIPSTGCERPTPRQAASN
ncbi:hypothetical protein [Burkholderia sp. MS455]|uniref:hypothetical protein n=1 Tax=Burkholderia sp. MS455 TaxID=2811788 RepID=UPI0019561AAD|nr:hypothetical protein [Burkholderia sp. MS455]